MPVSHEYGTHTRWLPQQQLELEQEQEQQQQQQQQQQQHRTRVRKYVPVSAPYSSTAAAVVYYCCLCIQLRCTSITYGTNSFLSVYFRFSHFQGNLFFHFLFLPTPQVFLPHPLTNPTPIPSLKKQNKRNYQVQPAAEAAAAAVRNQTPQAAQNNQAKKNSQTNIITILRVSITNTESSSIMSARTCYDAYPVRKNNIHLCDDKKIKRVLY